jgi:hypothetical protein
MRWPVVLSLLVLVTPSSSGCGRAANDPAPAGADDTAKILKSITESIKTGAPAAPGVNRGVAHVGSHTLRTTIDMPVSTVMQDERAVVSFGGRKVAVEFDRGRVVVDGAGDAKLPAGTKEVEIEFLGGKLSVKADGTAVVTPGAPG